MIILVYIKTVVEKVMGSLDIKTLFYLREGTNIDLVGRKPSNTHKRQQQQGWEVPIEYLGCGFS